MGENLPESDYNIDPRLRQSDRCDDEASVEHQVAVGLRVEHQLLLGGGRAAGPGRISLFHHQMDDNHVLKKILRGVNVMILEIIGSNNSYLGRKYYHNIVFLRKTQFFR
jgi:hypothetical protein